MSHAISRMGASLLASIVGLSAASAATMVGGAPMYPSRTIVQNAGNAKNLTTLVAAVKAAGLVDTLQGPGPFTVFAPTNSAFEKLPPGTVKGLLQPDKKSALTGILTYHVVPGKLTVADLDRRIRDGGGSAMLKTVQGEDLRVSRKGRAIYITDAKGGMARVVDRDVMQSNGVVDVINAVLMP